VKIPTIYPYPDSFEAFYNGNGKKAGTYTRSDAKAEKWTFTPL
jgi:hypothetical protein